MPAQAAFGAGGGVAVQDAFVDHAVNDRLGFLVGDLCSGLVAAPDGLEGLLDVGAHA